MHLCAQVFERMCQQGVAIDGVTCCSLISAMDKAGAWPIAEQFFVCMCQSAMLDALVPTTEPDLHMLSPDVQKLMHRVQLCLAGGGPPPDSLMAFQDHNAVDQGLAALFAHVQLGPRAVCCPALRCAIPRLHASRLCTADICWQHASHHSHLHFVHAKLQAHIGHTSF